MEKLYSPTTIKTVTNKYDFHMSKSLGQNFLVDGNIVNKIIEGSEIGEEDLVLEIGPGMGVLTAAAAEKAAKVIAVELDHRLIPVLEDTLKDYDNITIHQGDIMKTDLRALISEAKKEPKPFSAVKIIGNLPYYITTPILMKLLEEDARDYAYSITVMVQKEVAERMRAVPGGKIYGALSVAVQYYCEVELLAIVPKEVFFPKPKVDSAVLRLILRKEPPVSLLSEEMFFRVVRAGFGQRRKTLLNSLSAGIDVGKEVVTACLAEADIDPTRRAETLNMNEFACLANVFTKKGISAQRPRGEKGVDESENGME
ncbi:MAG: 16S rRNA (adenine(1518)-N(6)/adenine(1519)-N(6))-dimethyltransferase RsmA [Eubacteriales bacterium]|nr:16S rRNA (adenine(1518)-N(6)/adenine(1519)-N(6))-dimethyltransferase RsmA [Eubacteriales bacterium]